MFTMTVRNSRGGSSHVSQITQSEMAEWHRCHSGFDHVCDGRYRCAPFSKRGPFFARGHDQCLGIAKSQSVAGEEAQTFDRLIGSWDADFGFPQADGTVRHKKGEL